MPTKPLRACLASFRRPPCSTTSMCRKAHLAQTKRRQTLRGRSARGGTKAGVCDAGGAGGRPLQPKGRGHSVERQAELVCPRHPGPDGSPRSATFCLEAHEGYHDRSRVFARPHVVEARCGARCHPQGRWCGVNVLTPIGGVSQGRPSQGGLPQSSDVVGMRCLFLTPRVDLEMSAFAPLARAKRTSPWGAKATRNNIRSRLTRPDAVAYFPVTQRKLASYPDTWCERARVMVSTWSSCLPCGKLSSSISSSGRND